MLYKGKMFVLIKKNCMTRTTPSFLNFSVLYAVYDYFEKWKTTVFFIIIILHHSFYLQIYLYGESGKKWKILLKILTIKKK